MAQFLNDTFTDFDDVLLANHTGETGATWVVHPSYVAGFKITSNMIRASVASTWLGYYSSGVPSTVNQTIVGNLHYYTSNSSGLYILARMNQAMAIYYYFGYYQGSGQWILGRMFDGSSTTLATWTENLVGGNEREFKLVVSGTNPTTVEGWVAGVKRCDYSDTAADIRTKGSVGVRLYSGGTTANTGLALKDITGDDSAGAALIQSTIKAVTNKDSAGFGNARNIVRTSTGTLWAFYSKTSGTHRQMFAIKSTDGENWINATQISIEGTNHNAFYATAAVDSNDIVHVVYTHEDADSNEQFYYTYYDGSWNKPEALTSGAHMHYLPVMAIDSANTLHLAFFEDTTPESIRYLRKPSGAAWDAQATICEEEGYDQKRASICVGKDDLIHVVWAGYLDGVNGDHTQIRYRYSDDGGDTFEAIQTLTSDDWNSTDLGSAYGVGLCIACDPATGYPHIVWHAPSSSAHKQIRYINWNGAAWSAITDLTADTTYDQIASAIAFDKDGSIHVLWCGQSTASPTYSQIRYIKYSAGWGAISNLTAGTIDQLYPIMLFGRWRIYGAQVVNTPQTGFAFIWSSYTSYLKVCFSSDLAWDTTTAGVSLLLLADFLGDNCGRM